MTRFMHIVLISCAISLFGTLTSPAQAQSAAQILSQLDQAAPSFTGASAAIRVINHTAVINEDEEQIGTIAVKRSSPSEMRFLINFTGPDAQSVSLRGRTLEVYYPKLKTIRQYDITKYKDLAQKLTLVGFGMPGREIAANYEVNDLGEEQVGEQDSVHLQLTPKSADVLRQLSRIDLWVSLKTNCPVQQKFYMPAGDYRVVTYSDLKVNPNLPASALELPKGAKRERVN
jgi:outer membrane lipoprotein-sorting protein